MCPSQIYRLSKKCPSQNQKIILIVKTKQQQKIETMTKEIFKQVKNFCCREIGRKEWEQMTTANKTLLLACRRYFNWASAASLRQENHNDPWRKSKHPLWGEINYFNYPTACKPTVDSMINWWKASGLSQVE